MINRIRADDLINNFIGNNYISFGMNEDKYYWGDVISVSPSQLEGFVTVTVLIVNTDSNNEDDRLYIGLTIGVPFKIID